MPDESMTENAAGRASWPTHVQQRMVEIQDKVDAAGFVVGDINFWMIVRLQAFMSQGRNTDRLYRGLFGIPSQVSLLHGAAVPEASAGMHVETVQNGVLLRKTTQPEATLDGSLAFVGVPADATDTLGDTVVDVFSDPFIRIFSSSMKTVKLCRFERQVFKQAFYVEPLWFWAAGMAGRLDPKQVSPLFEILAAANRLLAEETGLRLRFDPAAVLAQIRYVLACHDLACALFRRQRPKALFCSNFANLEKMGFLLAAKRLGIPTVDLMHGFQDRLSLPLDHPVLPRGVLYPFPDALWCWGPVTRDSLLAQEKQRPQAWRHVAVAGYPWKSSRRELAGDYPGLDRLRKTIPAGRKVVLYCHEPSIQNAEFFGYLPSDVFTAMAWGDDVFWLVRTHPRSRHLREGMKDFMTRHGLVHFEIDMASECPLDELFPLADVLVTKYSVAAMEAAAAGVPVVCTHPVGKEIFAEHIASGHVTYCDGWRALLEAVRTARPPREPLRYIARDDGHALAWRALDETLRLGGPQAP